MSRKRNIKETEIIIDLSSRQKGKEENIISDIEKNENGEEKKVKKEESLLCRLFDSKESTFANLLLPWLDQIDLRTLSVCCKGIKKCIEENVTKEEWKKRVIQPEYPYDRALNDPLNSIHTSFACMQRGYFSAANDWFSSFHKGMIKENTNDGKKDLVKVLDYGKIATEITSQQCIKNKHNSITQIQRALRDSKFENYFEIYNFGEVVIRNHSSASYLHSKLDLNLQKERKFQIAILSNLFSSFMELMSDEVSGRWLDTLSENQSTIELFKIAFSSANGTVKISKYIYAYVDKATIIGNNEVVKYIYENAERRSSDAPKLAARNGQLETLKLLLPPKPSVLELFPLIKSAANRQQRNTLNYLIKSYLKTPIGSIILEELKDENEQVKEMEISNNIDNIDKLINNK